MKILIVSTSFPLKPGDSLSPFVWEYCLYLKKLGWDVTTIVPHHRGIERREVWDGITIIRFRYLPDRYEDLAYSGGLIPGLKKRPWRVIRMPFYVRAMYKESLRTAIEGCFDIVNFHWLFPACFWLKRFIKKAKIPVVLTGHGTDVHLARKIPFRYFADAALQKSSALTLNSLYMKGLLDRENLPERVEIIPMGVDTDKFSPGPIKPSRSRKFIFIGRLIKQKGIYLLIDAFSRIIEDNPGAELEIVGYGPEFMNLKAIINTKGISEFASLSAPVDHDRLPDKYRAARVLVLPSLVSEGFGMTAAEASACGVPTITFGLGGTSDLVVHEDTGLVVDRNVDALAAGLNRLLSDDGLVDDLGGKARKRVEDLYGWDKISQKFDRLFREILENHQSPS